MLDFPGMAVVSEVLALLSRENAGGRKNLPPAGDTLRRPPPTEISLGRLLSSSACFRFSRQQQPTQTLFLQQIIRTPPSCLENPPSWGEPQSTI